MAIGCPKCRKCCTTKIFQIWAISNEHANVVQGIIVAGPTYIENFAKIMEDANKQRNVLGLKINRSRPQSGPNPAEDFGELLFDKTDLPLTKILGGTILRK